MKRSLLVIYLMVIFSVYLNGQNNHPKTNQAYSMSKGEVIKDFYLTDDNNKMYYEVYGSGNTAILFVHGWSVTCRTWDDQVSFFKDRFKVILVDLPGFGNSEHNRQDWSMQHYGKDIDRLCRILKLRNVYLVGWSMGTAVVVEAARNLGNDAKAVITVDNLQQTDNPYDSLFAGEWFNKQASIYKNFDSFNKTWLNDSILTVRALKMMPSEDKMPDWWKPPVIRFVQWVSYDMKPCVSKLKIPIRAINASNPKTNEEQWKSFYRDYKVYIFENSNHFLFWQYPQKFNETLLKIIAETSKEPK